MQKNAYDIDSARNVHPTWTIISKVKLRNTNNEQFMNIQRPASIAYSASSG